MMTVRELKTACGLRLLTEGGSPAERAVSGCYIGDLRSWVMSHAGEGQAWLTVMGNVNAIAVAVLTGCACIVLCDGAPLDHDARLRAEEQGVAVLQSEESAYSLALKIGALLGK